MVDESLDSITTHDPEGYAAGPSGVRFPRVEASDAERLEVLGVARRNGHLGGLRVGGDESVDNGACSGTP